MGGGGVHKTKGGGNCGEKDDVVLGHLIKGSTHCRKYPSIPPIFL